MGSCSSAQRGNNMISPKVYHSLGLSDQEYKTILEILKREPTTTELAMFSVEWSEHCGYPSSRKWLKLLPKTGKYSPLIGEDAGGIVVDDLAIIFKMESHNHPSYVEPKQGAATGVGGIIRDIFTSGARPIALLDPLFFGSLKKPYNRYLLRGVVDGIQFYGNCVGVPTVGGQLYFDEGYNGNCLVNVMCIGIAQKNKVAKARAFGVGNAIIYAGSSTGRDGIGGCSVLASNEFKKDDQKRPTVQIGDPFTEKCLIEATLEALETGYVVGIKDMGAAGLTCCTSEMAQAGQSGMEVDLAKVALREDDMQAWEIMMSESQERMLLCVQAGKEEAVTSIFIKWGLNASVIGQVTSGQNVCIKYKGEVVANIDAQALTNAPIYDLKYCEPEYIKEVNDFNLADLPDIEKGKANRVLINLLKSANIMSKRWVYQQYDHMVQTNTVVLPGCDAAVMRIKGSKKAIAATTDCNSRYCYLSPYRGAQITIAEACRNLVCSGAEPAAVTDCLNFGNPKKPDRYWQFKNCLEGIIDACKFFNLPVVSGNVSFYNEAPKTVINPTPTIGMIGVVEDVDKVCNQYFKRRGEVIILLGLCKEDLGGSEYLKVAHKIVKGQAPQLDLNLEQAVQATTLESIKQGLVRSAHDCSQGGLAVALAQCCISDPENLIGAVIDNLPFDDLRTDALLFAESQSRIILSCKEEDVEKIKAIAQANNAAFNVIGITRGKKLIIKRGQEELISLSLQKMHDAWDKALEESIA